MAQISQQTRKKVVFLAYVVGVAVFLLVLPARFTAPARVVFIQAAGPLETTMFRMSGDAAAFSGTLRDCFLARERLRLDKKQVHKIANRNVVLKERLKQQNNILEDLKKLEIARPRFRTLGASVSSYDADPMHRSITLAAGSRKNIRKGQAVTAEGTLVGIIMEAGPWYSRVRLITDPASRLPCRIQRTRRRCILHGTGATHCEVEWVDRRSDVQPDDVLVTAPVSKLVSEKPLIPPGMPVATVKAVKKPREDPLFWRIPASPRVNLERLESVVVIIPAEAKKPGRAPVLK
ncbi:MAG: rod shape-determining protein MreC [Planctomycetes bacterium]|nr:rod shape-determining protein MreC [Planctomycetota bacterium]